MAARKVVRVKPRKFGQSVAGGILDDLSDVVSNYELDLPELPDLPDLNYGTGPDAADPIQLPHEDYAGDGPGVLQPVIEAYSPQTPYDVTVVKPPSVTSAPMYTPAASSAPSLPNTHPAASDNTFWWIAAGSVLALGVSGFYLLRHKVTRHMAGKFWMGGHR